MVPCILFDMMIMEQHLKHLACTDRIKMVRKSQLPISCPTDDMILWNAHPKVYLPLAQTGDELCPYCGTRFILQHED